MTARLLRRLPSPLVIVVATLCAILFTITLAKGLSDPDYFWHVTAGKLIATTGQVPSTDPFSFTWFGRPWTPHEWLSELLIYRLVSWLGERGALAAFSILGPATIALLAVAFARRRIATVPLVTSLIVAAAALIPYVTLRPQAESWFLMALLIGGLLELRADRPAWALLVVPLFVLWANLHGLWVVGLGILGAYLLYTLLGRTPMSPAWRWMLAGFIGAVLASMATPAGPIGILYPLRYIQPGDWGLANISEWQSPNFHDPAHWPLLILVVALIANAGRATPGWLTLLSYVGVVMALAALRNGPVAAVLAVPTLAFGLDDRWRSHFRRGAAQRPASVELGRRLLELTAAAIVVVSAVLIILPRSMGGIARADQASSYPQAAVDRLIQIKPNARVLAEYGWGGYVIYRMYQGGGRVFVDGRNDMYDQSVLSDYSTIRGANPGWRPLVDRYGVDAMLFPPGEPITKGPALDAGWCEAYRDSVGVLLLRTCPR